MPRSRRRLRREENEPRLANQVAPAPERNPLLNQVVLTRVFDFCKLSDLLKYRLVSKEWYSSSLLRIRNEATVKISNWNVGGSDDDDDVGDLSWTEFHQDFKVVGKQFKNFKLLHVEFVDSPPPSQLAESSFRYLWGRENQNFDIEQMYKNMEQFWRQCGQFITSLKLVQSYVFSVEAFKKAIFEATPNLEKLKIESVVIENGDDVPQDQGREDEVVNVNSNLKHLNLYDAGLERNERFPISWSVLFDHFPNIETLKKRVDRGNSGLVASLVTTLESQDEIHLKALIMNVKNQEQCDTLLRLFQLPKLELQRLELTFGYEIMIFELVQTAFRIQGDHLESLLVDGSGVIFESDEPEPMNNFPFRREPLQNLTKLELSGVCPNFNFLQQTPNLKYLQLFGSENIKILDKADMRILGTTTLPFLSEFHFCRRAISEKEMQGFVKIMPNVERFHAVAHLALG